MPGFEWVYYLIIPMVTALLIYLWGRFRGVKPSKEEMEKSKRRTSIVNASQT